MQDFQISTKISADFNEDFCKIPDSSADFDILILNFRMIWSSTAYMQIDTVHVQAGICVCAIQTQCISRSLHADWPQCTRNLQYRYLYIIIIYIYICTSSRLLVQRHIFPASYLCKFYNTISNFGELFIHLTWNQFPHSPSNATIFWPIIRQ